MPPHREEFRPMPFMGHYPRPYDYPLEGPEIVDNSRSTVIQIRNVHHEFEHPRPATTGKKRNRNYSAHPNRSESKSRQPYQMHLRQFATMQDIPAEVIEYRERGSVTYDENNRRHERREVLEISTRKSPKAGAGGSATKSRSSDEASSVQKPCSCSKSKCLKLYC